MRASMLTQKLICIVARIMQATSSPPRDPMQTTKPTEVSTFNEQIGPSLLVRKRKRKNRGQPTPENGAGRPKQKGQGSSEPSGGASGDRTHMYPRNHATFSRDSGQKGRCIEAIDDKRAAAGLCHLHDNQRKISPSHPDPVRRDVSNCASAWSLSFAPPAVRRPPTVPPLVIHSSISTLHV